MPNKLDILMVGVGGQGTILASKILSMVAQTMGYDVKVSEIHGMAQRGGSVVTQVRIGEKIYSPIIAEGQADIILAFEKLEALRWLYYLKPEGTIIINDQEIEPVPVILGVQKYPDDVIAQIKSRTDKTVVVNGLDLALKSGNVKALNVVLIGAMAKHIDIPENVWIEAIEEKVPARFLEANKKSFAAGYNI